MVLTFTDCEDGMELELAQDCILIMGLVTGSAEHSGSAAEC